MTVRTSPAQLLKGAVDLHVHSGPSLMPRAVDHFDAARQANDAGMRALLLKDHYYPTMPIAHLVNRHLDLDVSVLGAVVLNCPLGGINPSAVDYALKQGARIVWMSTAHAENHIEHDKKDADFKNKFPVNSKKTVLPVPQRLTDASGAVTDEVKLILDLVAEADAVISGGHHHVSELHPFYEEARARGVKRLFLNHPTYVNECSLEDIRQLVGLGVKMEHSICMFVPSTFKIFDEDHLRQVIDAGGVDATFFGSDLGQKNNPSPVEGMRSIIELLQSMQYSDADIVKMTATNAAELAGL